MYICILALIYLLIYITHNHALSLYFNMIMLYLDKNLYGLSSLERGVLFDAIFYSYNRYILLALLRCLMNEVVNDVSV